MERGIKGYVRIASFIFKCELIQKVELFKVRKSQWDIVVYILLGERANEVNIGSFSKYFLAEDYFNTIIKVLNGEE